MNCKVMPVEQMANSFEYCAYVCQGTWYTLLSIVFMSCNLQLGYPQISHASRESTYVTNVPSGILTDL